MQAALSLNFPKSCFFSCGPTAFPIKLGQIQLLVSPKISENWDCAPNQSIWRYQKPLLMRDIVNAQVACVSDLWPVI